MCVHDILFILFIYQQINLMNKTIFNKRASLKFSHFSNKGYSLFSVLGRVVAIGALSVTTLTYAKAEGISVEGAKADSVFIRGGKAYELDGVTVTGSRAPMTVELSPKIVTVMTREDIQRSAAQTINDVLKLATGVDVRQRGGFGVQTDISINGGTFDQIAIFLNGVNISNPQTGHNASDFPVALADIDHVEIIEGASSRVFGTSAFNGAINIVTKKASANGVEANVEAGSFGSLGAQGRLQMAFYDKNIKIPLYIIRCHNRQTERACFPTMLCSVSIFFVSCFSAVSCSCGGAVQRQKSFLLYAIIL